MSIVLPLVSICKVLMVHDRLIDEVLKYFERKLYLPKPLEVRAKKE